MQSIEFFETVVLEHPAEIEFVLEQCAFHEEIFEFVSFNQDASFNVISTGKSSPDDAAKFMQRFLQKFRPQKYAILEFSRRDEGMRMFGGGAAFITAEDIEWVDTAFFVQEKVFGFAKVV